MIERVECVVPVLQVKDLAASLDFYTAILGFQRDWGGDRPESIIAGISHGGKSMMLLQQREVSPATVWLGVGDVRTLHARCAERGLKIIQPPMNHPWAEDMRVEDPDGNELWFGSEPRT